MNPAFAVKKEREKEHEKIYALALALILTLSLSSCGNNGTASNDNSGSNSDDSAGKKQTIKLVIGAGHTVGSMEYLDSLENFFKPEVAKRVSENTDYEIEWTDAYGTVAGLSETVTATPGWPAGFVRHHCLPGFRPASLSSV